MSIDYCHDAERVKLGIARMKATKSAVTEVAMDIRELNLTPREQRILESMGFDNVEKIAACYGDDLGLGKSKGKGIVQRARNLLAYHGIKAIVETEQQVAITLSDRSRATVVSVEDILEISSELKTELQDSQMIIFKPECKPCSACGAEPICLCTICGASLCEKCRYEHGHGYYDTIEIQTLERVFARVRENARTFTPMPPEKRMRVEGEPDEEVAMVARAEGFTGFAESFFHELGGNELMKKALACALFSTPQEPVHVLIVGDPAGGKTLARDIIARKLGSEIELVGANATRSGLVCNLATGEPGVLTYSNGKVVLVDEFDKIPDHDVEYCLELLSNGKCSVHSARIHETLESHFIMIAFANPMKTVFTEEPINEIGLPPILLSRFALIVKAEELEAGLRKALLRRKLLGGRADSDLSSWHLPWLREARKSHPRFTTSEERIERYIDSVDSLIGRYLKTPLRCDLRMGDYAKRVPLAIARAGFADVDDAVIDEALQLMEDCVAAWSLSG